MRILIVLGLVLATASWAQQYVPPQGNSRAMPAKTYNPTAAQKQRLQKAATEHKNCMARKDQSARNACFHSTHHAFHVACEQIKKQLNADPAATCNMETLEVKQ